MEMARIAGIVLTALGAVLLAGSFTAYARRKLTEDFGMIWVIVAVCFLGGGIVLIVMGQSVTALFVVTVLLGVLLVAGLFGFSRVISILVMKNQELAMQVSLLNQENESFIRMFTAKKEENTHE
ncbi:MAG: hypothetical protein NC420_13580 [Eubacterium sp.]|nr:hypothetical protein [Eubacterium sp.]